MDTPRPGPHRFLAALGPGERGMTVFFLLAAFACGVVVGFQIAPPARWAGAATR